MNGASRFSIREVAAREHLPEQYASWYEGYRALQAVDNDGTLRGELVWRLATGQTVEIPNSASSSQKTGDRAWVQGCSKRD